MPRGLALLAAVAAVDAVKKSGQSTLLVDEAGRDRDVMREDEAGRDEAGNSTLPQGRVVLLPGIGCSGTTFIWRKTLDLIVAHGERFFSPCGSGKEFLNPKNCLDEAYCVDANGKEMSWPADTLERMEAAQQLLDGKSACRKLLCRGKALDGTSICGRWGKIDQSNRPAFMIFSAVGTPDDVQAAAVEVLAKDPRNSVAGTVRTNTLRQEICTDMDGWGKTGHQVDEDGNNSTMGIERRHSNGHMMVHLDVERIKTKLANAQKNKFPHDRLTKALTKHGFATDFVSYEDLSAYEFDAADLPRSLKAWTTLLERAGVKVQPEIVEAALRPDVGARTASSLKDVIYNYDDVRSTLMAGESADDFVKMLESGF